MELRILIPYILLFLQAIMKYVTVCPTVQTRLKFHKSTVASYMYIPLFWLLSYRLNWLTPVTRCGNILKYSGDGNSYTLTWDILLHKEKFHIHVIDLCYGRCVHYYRLTLRIHLFFRDRQDLPVVFKMQLWRLK